MSIQRCQCMCCRKRDDDGLTLLNMNQIAGLGGYNKSLEDERDGWRDQIGRIAEDLLIKTEANDVLRSINKALSQRIQEQDAEITELKQEISSRNAINKMCVNEMDELENKIIAQDAIIKMMEEALRKIRYRTQSHDDQGAVEYDCSNYSREALTALHEFRNRNEK